MRQKFEDILTVILCGAVALIVVWFLTTTAQLAKECAEKGGVWRNSACYSRSAFIE